MLFYFDRHGYTYVLLHRVTTLLANPIPAIPRFLLVPWCIETLWKSTTVCLLSVFPSLPRNSVVTWLLPVLKQKFKPYKAYSHTHTIHTGT